MGSLGNVYSPWMPLFLTLAGLYIPAAVDAPVAATPAFLSVETRFLDDKRVVIIRSE